MSGYLFLVIFISVLVAIIGIGIKSNGSRTGKGKNVTVQFTNPDTGRAMYSGHGNSVGSAMSDSFYKLSSSVSMSSRPDTIQRNLNSMRETLSQNRYRMSATEISNCEHYISQVSRLLQNKEDQRRVIEQKRVDEKNKAEQVKVVKNQSASAHKRFVAAQRRLMTDSLRYDVLRRDNFRCQLCGATAKDGVTLHVDHIFPVSKGGKTEMANLRTLCERCNMGKRDKIETPISTTDTPNSVDELIISLRAQNIKYEIEKIYNGYAVKSTPEVDSFINSLGESIFIKDITYYGNQSNPGYVWRKKQTLS